jgi:diguanylate cyclase (GGDEF)-like protein/PAS domain S-box-containing protein
MSRPSTHRDQAADLRLVGTLPVLAAGRELVRAALDALPVPTLVTDTSLRVVHTNPAWGRLTGAASAAGPTTWLSLFEERDRSYVRDVLAGALHSGRELAVEVRTASGDRWLELRAAPSDEPDEHALVVVAFDATDRKRAEARLVFDATHDPLTRLHNRTALIEYTDLALARRLRHPAPLAVLFIDIDRFKEINDVQGHGAGDRVLMSVAERLRRAVRPSDAIARVGGDEFVVVCDMLSGAEEARGVARRLASSLETPVQISAFVKVHLTAAIGIAFARYSTERPLLLIDRADRQMYRAKKRGPGSISAETLFYALDPPGHRDTVADRSA